MMSVNEVTLLGHVGRDPEVRAAQTGTLVANLSLATSVRNKDGTQITDWHKLTAFGKLAETIQSYVHAGDPIYVRGRISYSQSEKDGVKRYFTDIIVYDIRLLSSKLPATASPDSKDDLPF